MSKRPKAYSYLRFSTPEQMSGDSFRRQIEAATAYAERHGLDLDTDLTFRDLGVSAFRGKNIVDGQLGQFIKAVETGKVKSGSYLLVENLDRLSRDRIMPALNQFPDQMTKLRQDPSVIPNMVSEIIRWQTPLAHMRRTALEDCEVGGQQIKKGDKVVMWYVSGNRDEDKFVNANDFVIDRPNARQHIAFGFGLHRCMGNRVAEMQLRIAWEEILNRFSKLELVGDPVRVRSSFVKGYLELPVVLG